jgi:type IV pilus assembly protein PilB
LSRATKSIADTLLAMGAIDEHQLQAANAHATQWSLPLHEAVVERRFCSRDDVVRAFSIQTGYPVINLDAQELDRSLAMLLPLKLAEQHRVVPLGLLGRRYEIIDLAVAVPAEIWVIDAILAVTRRQRANVHLASEDAIQRAIARLYSKGTVPSAAEPPPAPVPVREVAVQNEETFDLEAQSAAPAPAPPVRLYGWHPAMARALKMMLERGGVAAVDIDDEQLEKLNPEDVLISTTLGLRTVLPTDARLKMKLIICGTGEAGDSEDARALGAKLFLRPPLSTEQLVAAIKRVRQ